MFDPPAPATMVRYVESDANLTHLDLRGRGWGRYRV